MRALRFLKGADGEEDVWQEWIRVEVVYVERIKKRWELLGIGKKSEGVPEADRMDVEGEGEAEEVDLSQIEAKNEQPSAVLDQTAKSVAVSGQDAIRDGAVVRMVLDSCLTCQPSLFTSLPVYATDAPQQPTRTRSDPTRSS